MDSLNLNKHISGQFNAELESIRTQVMTMGGMVEQQLSDAITAMHNQDSDLAKRHRRRQERQHDGSGDR